MKLLLVGSMLFISSMASFANEASHGDGYDRVICNSSECDELVMENTCVANAMKKAKEQAKMNCIEAGGEPGSTIESDFFSTGLYERTSTGEEYDYVDCKYETDIRCK